MENFPLTKREFSIKSWLGIPSWILSLIAAIYFSSVGWLVYIGIFIVGWYLYTLLYWKLYQRYMLDKISKEKLKFYGLLVGYQMALFGAVAIYAFSP